jgi:hypothetical protein
MAKIPDIQVLGDRPTPQAQRQVMGYRVAEVVNPMGWASDLGEKARKVGLTIEDDHNKLQAQQAKADWLTRTLELEDKYRNDVDYKTLKTRYSTDLDKIKSETLSSVQDDKYRQMLDIDLQESTARNMSAVGDRVNSLWKDDQIAGTKVRIDSMNDAFLRTGDTKYVDSINALADGLSPIAGKQYASELKRSAGDSIIKRQTEMKSLESRAALLKRFSYDKDGNSLYAPAGDIIDRLSPDVIMQIGNDAVREQKRLVGAVDSGISAVKERMTDGYLPTQQELNDISSIIKETGNAESADKFNNLLTLQSDVATYKGSSLIQVQDFIQSVLEPAARKDGATELEYDRLKIARSFLDNARREIKNNPMQYAVNSGLETINVVDMTANPADLGARDIAADTVRRQYNANGFFIDDELSAITEQLDKSSPDDKINFYKNLKHGAPNNYITALAQLGEKTSTVNAYLAGMALSGSANETTARKAMSGLDMLKVNPEMVDNNSINSEIDRHQKVFEYYFLNNPEAMGAIFHTAKALMAVGAAKSPSDAVTQAIGTGVSGNTILPIGVEESDFNNFVEGANMKQFLSMSIDRGIPVRQDGALAKESDLNDPSKYRMVAMNKYVILGGDKMPLYNNFGRPYIIDLSKENILKYGGK